MVLMVFAAREGTGCPWFCYRFIAAHAAAAALLQAYCQAMAAVGEGYAEVNPGELMFPFLI